ncbi:gamma-butyrobetaine hydroxylase-like domain-containing protein [Chitinibacter sp. S2-10]|uniref:gamma-butyrobetaine hydroxylase-like domain-containing protein n=1 Tax=Chitinibacter sp. S2-10 TaxID=3373597 RepID=UPI003977E224
MAGLNADTPQVTAVTLHQATRALEIVFADGAQFKLPCEYLRVFSPSAEVRGHGVGNEVLQVGKIGVNIKAIEPVGHYALKLVFDDGHDSGLFSWQYLYELGANYDAYWQKYLTELAAAGASREPI